MSQSDADTRNNTIESLRKELVDVVAKTLSPIAHEYNYTDTRLENNIKWKPIVLILGNYSSGKSTLINELLGTEVQQTGQAPTDDSFTVLTHGDGSVATRDGKVLLNDEQYPFASLRKHGSRFSSHFRLKTVPSDLLESLAIIDTPGMLDSVAEKDRGYNYQEVIGTLAEMADLILVLFDPHKAGTVRETYHSLRDTLPKATYEDRVLFVLNRIDECSNLNDLLRVYGTMCWNLSQMTGRKDIPHIHLTYSPKVVDDTNGPRFLPLLENQRSVITAAIKRAPTNRLDNLVSYVENHGRKMTMLLSVLKGFSALRRKYLFKVWMVGIIAAVLLGFASYWAVVNMGLDGGTIPPAFTPLVGVVTMVIVLGIWWLIIRAFFQGHAHKKALEQLDELVTLESEDDQENWRAIEPVAKARLAQTAVNLGKVKSDLKKVRAITDKTSKSARQTLSEIHSAPEVED